MIDECVMALYYHFLNDRSVDKEVQASRNSMVPSCFSFVSGRNN